MAGRDAVRSTVKRVTLFNRLLSRLGWRLVRVDPDKELAKQAARIADSPEATALAKANAESILAALAEGRAICKHCFNPFERKPRPWAENVRIRSILMIPDREPDSIFCDACAYSAVAGFNGQATNVGTRNDGPANLVLQRLG